MVQINVNYKSDFNAILGIEGGWGVPFTARFWTQSPSRYFEASWDGQDGYKNCHRESDGRICFGFDNHNMGTGKLMMDLTFYLDNSCFADGICSEHITPFQPTFVRPVYDEKGKKIGEEEYYVMLDYKGQCSITTIGTLPAYYQAGLTPEEHQALIDATAHAEQAAGGAEEKAGQAAEAARLANEAREQITANYREKVAALEADYAEKKQMLDADYAGVKNSLAADYTEVKGGLQSDYQAKKAALDADYAGVKSGLAQDYAEKKQALEADYAGVKSGLKSDYDSKTAALAQDYTAKKAALDADYEAKKAALEANYTDVKAALSASYSEAIAGINQRMSAIESQFATDKAAWQKAVEDAVNAANTAATEASRVNVINNGTVLTIVGRDGQVHTVNVKGEKGDPGESFTMFPNVTIFGQPRIQESQISGFSANDYVQMPMVVDFAGRPWQIDFAFTTGANVTAQQNILDSMFGMAFAVANGKMEIAMSSNGTDWNMGAHFGTHNLSANTTYYVRITFDGTKYVVAMSTGGVEYVTDIQVASTASLYPRQIVIGKGVDGTHVFGGSIDLMKAHLVISGKAVWDGMADAGLATRMAVDMSNIDEAGKHKVLEIVGEGTALVVNHEGLLCMEFEQPEEE